MNKDRETLVVMSVDRATKSNSVNAANRVLFRKYLDRLGFEYDLAESVYIEDGQDDFGREQSFIIECEDSVSIALLHTVAAVFEQEYMLKVENGFCKLMPVLVGCKYENLGKWVKVDEDVAKDKGYYTKTKDGYFIAR